MTSDAPGWRDTAVLLFVLLNLTVIGGDVAIAHAGNHYRAPAEWWPVEATFIFFAAAIGIVAPWAIRGVQPLGRTGRVILRTVFVLAIALGVYGLAAHFLSQSARGTQVRRYIFSAPIIAPLAYAGLGILGLAFLDLPHRVQRRRFYWLCATLGLAGNAVLVLQDHAQSGFFTAPELFAVGAAAVPVPVAALTAFRSEARREQLLGANVAVALLSVLTGMLGVFFHVHALLRDFGTAFTRWTDGAPPLAPGLLTDLGLFVLLLVWKERGERRDRVSLAPGRGSEAKE